MPHRIDAQTLFYGLQNMGYSPADSVADIIDNSIEAKAKNIDIIFWEGSINPVVAIMDDGVGMDAGELDDALKYKKDTSADNKLSKFGFGLKTASFSQCEILTIVTKKKNQTSFKSVNSKLEPIETNLLNIFNKFKFIEKKFQERCQNSGTIVIWENLFDNITGKNSQIRRTHAIFFEVGKKITERAATHFHNFMDDVKIYFNNMEIAKWDPFNTSLESLKIFEEKKLKLKNHDVLLKGYVFPKEDEFDNTELYETLGGPLGWFNSQGIYLYREKRLLTHGGWFGLRNGGSNPWQLESKYQRCRITIHYEASLDEYFKPNVQKTKSEIPTILRHEITNYCDEVRKYCNERRTSPRLVTHEIDENIDNLLVKNGDGKYSLNINHPNIQLLINKNISSNKREYVLDQINKQIKKIQDA